MKNAKWLWVILGYIFVAVIGPVITNKITSKSPNIKIICNMVKTTPYIQDTIGKLHIDYESDSKISAIQFQLTNKGNKEDHNFEMKVYTFNNISIKKSTITFEPQLLENRIDASETDSFSFYRKLSTFPCRSEVVIDIITTTPFSEGDIKYEFLSNLKNWNVTYEEINLKKNNSKLSEILNQSFLNHSVFAGTNKSGKTNSSSPKDKKQKSAGILIGGYDPILLSNNLFILLQKKRIINQKEAKAVKTIIEKRKEGLLIGGINILKFYEVTLNLMIKGNVISINEAKSILENAKKSGGVLIGGYNIIVLDVGILNVLLHKGRINLDEGQKAIDSAKPTRK